MSVATPGVVSQRPCSRLRSLRRARTPTQLPRYLRVERSSRAREIDTQGFTEFAPRAAISQLSRAARTNLSRLRNQPVRKISAPAHCSVCANFAHQADIATRRPRQARARGDIRISSTCRMLSPNSTDVSSLARQNNLRVCWTNAVTQEIHEEKGLAPVRGHKSSIRMVGRRGIERRTNGLRVRPRKPPTLLILRRLSRVD
jgi:hypothetical protein